MLNGNTHVLMMDGTTNFGVEFYSLRSMSRMVELNQQQIRVQPTLKSVQSSSLKLLFISTERNNQYALPLANPVPFPLTYKPDKPKKQTNNRRNIST